MFKEILQEVVDSSDGAVAGLLMGYDGIPIEKYVREGGTMDVESIGMELSVVLKDIRKAAEMLHAGDAREVAIRAERLTTVIRLLNDEYFLAVALEPSGNAGKARFLARMRSAALTEALG